MLGARASSSYNQPSAHKDLTNRYAWPSYNPRMRRQLAIAALCVAILGTPLWAQMHRSFGGAGGGSCSRGYATSGRTTFSARPAGGFRGGPAFAATPRFGSRFGSGFGPQFRPRFGTNFGMGFRRPFVSRRFVRHGFRSGFSPFYFGYYGYPAYYAGYSYSSLDAYPAYDYYAPYPPQSGNDLAQQQQQRDIDRLEDDVSHLREEQESREDARRKATVEVKSTPTLLVFRDKHIQEVQNYAVVGGTLWLFSEQRATKLPLSWLDIDATTKANDERGVDFRLPK
jgi:hypothetical protein